MEAEIAALIGAGGTALVELMVTDAWGQAKQLATRLLGRNSAQEEAVGEDLELARQDLIDSREAGDTEREAELAAEWSSRLRRAVQREPGNAHLLEELLALHLQQPGAETSTSFHVVARDNSRVYQQGSGTQINY